MKNNIQIFENNQFGKVRVSGTYDNPWFCLADICKAVGLQNPSSVKARLDPENVQLIDLHALNSTEGGNMKTNFVDESGLYDVLFQSNSPKVKPFRKWVTSEVLPTIRKTGSYSLKVPKTFAEALRLAADQQEEIERQKSQINELTTTVNTQQPKVEVYNTLMDNKTALSMNEVAKIIDFVDEHGRPIGRTKLFGVLREKGVLMQNNIPYQKYIALGYFRVVEVVCRDNTVRSVTKVYQKGVELIINKLKEKNYKQNKQLSLKF